MEKFKIPTIFKLNQLNDFELIETINYIHQKGRTYTAIYDRNAIIQKDDICQFDRNSIKISIITDKSEMIGNDNDQEMIIYRPLCNFRTNRF